MWAAEKCVHRPFLGVGLGALLAATRIYQLQPLAGPLLGSEQAILASAISGHLCMGVGHMHGRGSWSRSCALLGCPARARAAQATSVPALGTC